MTDAETADPAAACSALVTLLDADDADYMRIDHEPAGATEAVSALRGHPLEQAAKCLLIMVKLDWRTRRYVLAVVPGDKSVDLAAVKALYGAATDRPRRRDARSPLTRRHHHLQKPCTPARPAA